MKLRRIRTAAACASALVLAGSAASGQLWFEDVWDTTGMVYDGLGATGPTAGAVVDIDADGWMDILLVGSTAHGTKLYRNRGDGTFEDVSAAWLPPLLNAQMAMFADLNNDGLPDLLYGQSTFTTDVVSRLQIFRNTGGGFVQINTLPDSAENGWVGGITVGDYDRDGDLDVYISKWVGASWLLRNDGDFVFTNVTDTAGPPSLRESALRYCSVFADFNNDDWADLHVAVDRAPDYHFRNNKDGTMLDVSSICGANNVGEEMGVAVGDIDNDLDLDIFSTNLMYNHVLYVNQGTGFFTQEADQRGVRLSGIGWGTAFVDFDHDTDVDLFHGVQAMPGMPDSDPNDAFYFNDGYGYFTLASAAVGLSSTQWNFSVVPFDYDNDGDYDLLICGNSSAPPNRPLLMRNTNGSQLGHWLIVRLIGRQSNRDSVGARVYATAGGTTMMRELLGGGSYAAGLPLEVHFGFGAATTIDELRIVWPSGAERVLTNVPADQYLTLTEPRVLTPRRLSVAP